MDPPTAPRLRLQSPDALRGVIMIIMVLDHVRDFVHRDAQHFNPTDLRHTYPILFFTRWITHFCAPNFLFLAGIGAFLWSRRGRTPSELSRYLLTRGLWLIFLEVVVLRFFFNFNFSLETPLLFIILTALGASMIVLAALSRLPMHILAVLSVATILLHNFFDPIAPARLGSLAPLWTILHAPGAIFLGPAMIIFGYPLIPWFAVMSAGFCFGKLFLLPPERRRPIFLRLGIGLTAAFLLLRTLNLYGDPVRWTHQSTLIYTLLSFFNLTKQPPSLLFLLMTIGPALILLSWLDTRTFSARNPVLVFGRVPLFFFLTHFFLAHLFADLLNLLRYGRASLPFLLHGPPSVGGPENLFPRDFGFTLWVVYAVWLAILIILYPICRWYGRFKSERQNWWLSYL